MEITLKPTYKQHLTYEALKNDSVKYVLFGGAAGGGKSWLGAEWLLRMCIMYPGTKWFIGRQELKRLMSSSFVTFKKVCSHHNIPEHYWKLNGQYNYIEFKNGSRIDLLDLARQPSDPMYERFGSLEYTGGWIEEAGEIDFDAYDTLKSRIGRHMNKEYEIRSKMLLTCNPKKNFLYSEYYKPWKETNLEPNKVFIQALPNDNKYTAEDYVENLLELKDESKKQRLLFGNWDYDDDPTKIFEYDAIQDMFTNNVEVSHDDKKYLVVDAAGQGGDKATFYVWKGWEVVRIDELEKCHSEELEQKILDIINEERIPRSQCIIDKNGIGWAIPGHLRIKGFISQSSPIQSKAYLSNPKANAGLKSNHSNLRAQCFFFMANKVNMREVGIRVNKYKEQLIQELEVIKEINKDSEKTLKIIKKQSSSSTEETIKSLIGRSPDHADNFAMRAWFELSGSSNKGSLRKSYKSHYNRVLSANGVDSRAFVK